jgi:uncharacterized protein
MDYFLLTIAIIILILGLIGCLLPVLPGPPLSFVAIIILQFTRFADFSGSALLFFGALALIVQVLDYIVPAWGTKKFGGSKYGMWGAIIGLIAGIFVLPALGLVLGPFGLIGILGGPFVGALIGERMAGKGTDKAMRAAFGSFIGFLAGTFMKLVTSGIITFFFVKELIR